MADLYIFTRNQENVAMLDAQIAVMGLRFIYSELERQLLRVEVREYRLELAEATTVLARMKGQRQPG